MDDELIRYISITERSPIACPVGGRGASDVGRDAERHETIWSSTSDEILYLWPPQAAVPSPVPPAEVGR